MHDYYIKLYRFFARSVLIPFVHEAPPVALDVLEELLHLAPAAIPEALQIGHYLDVMESEVVYALVTRIHSLEEELTRSNGRLIMRYACYACNRYI